MNKNYWLRLGYFLGVCCQTEITLAKMATSVETDTWRRWLSDKLSQTTQHGPFFFSRKHNSENIIRHKVTRREIYYIERENDFPFSMEHHSSLFCMYPVALFRNTWRERLTENINLRSATHLYSAHCHPLLIFNMWCLRGHNRCLTLIPIKLMGFFLRFVFPMKTKLLREASKQQRQKQFLCRIIIKRAANKKEGEVR